MNKTCWRDWIPSVKLFSCCKGGWCPESATVRHKVWNIHTLLCIIKLCTVCSVEFYRPFYKCLINGVEFYRPFYKCLSDYFVDVWKTWTTLLHVHLYIIVYMLIMLCTCTCALQHISNRYYGLWLLGSPSKKLVFFIFIS